MMSQRAAFLFALSTIVAACASESKPRATRASASLYVRSDSNATQVVSPKVEASGQATEKLAIDASYEIDAWSGASIDVTTAATARIREVRHEVNTGGSYEHETTTASASYRHSNEPDYQSHGVALGVSRDFARRNTTLGLNLLGSRDVVGRVGDPFFARAQWTGGAQLRASQVLSSTSLVQLRYDLLSAHGFQASPYRWVALGGSGTCFGDAAFCVPENVPEARYRHAIMADYRRALGTEFSVGLGYRYYVDSWGVQSHTASPDVAYVLSDAAHLRLRYRYYTQGEADFYRQRYADSMTTSGYVTRDRKLSAFYSHEADLSYTHDVSFAERTASVAMQSGLTRFRYLGFTGLERVWAFSATISAALSWE